MPRTVDQDARRRRIADAVFVLMSSRGFAGVNLRGVAQEAGVSMGAVQHWFASKDDMLQFAMTHLHTRVLTRLQARLAELDHPSLRDLLRAGALAQLPLDEASRQEAIVNVAFVSSAMTAPEYAEKLRLGYRRMLDTSSALLRDAIAAGEANAAIDLDHEASAFYLLVQGMVGPLLVGALTSDQAVGIIDHQLDRLLAVPPR